METLDWNETFSYTSVNIEMCTTMQTHCSHFVLGEYSHIFLLSQQTDYIHLIVFNPVYLQESPLRTWTEKKKVQSNFNYNSIQWRSSLQTALKPIKILEIQQPPPLFIKRISSTVIFQCSWDKHSQQNSIHLFDCVWILCENEQEIVKITKRRLSGASEQWVSIEMGHCESWTFLTAECWYREIINIRTYGDVEGVDAKEVLSPLRVPWQAGVIDPQGLQHLLIKPGRPTQPPLQESQRHPACSQGTICTGRCSSCKEALDELKLPEEHWDRAAAYLNQGHLCKPSRQHGHKLWQHSVWDPTLPPPRLPPVPQMLSWSCSWPHPSHTQHWWSSPRTGCLWCSGRSAGQNPAGPATPRSPASLLQRLCLDSIKHTQYVHCKGISSTNPGHNNPREAQLN